MQAGTTFHLITGGIEEALAKAREAAGATDVKIGRGVAVVRQFIQAGNVDEIHLTIAPVALGRGEALFRSRPPRAGHRTVEHAAICQATHIVLAKSAEEQSPS